MHTLKISLPEQLQAFIEAQVATGRYGDATEYIHHLVAEDRERLAQQKLESILLEGLDSGKSIESTDLWWQEKRDRLISKARQNND